MQTTQRLKFLKDVQTKLAPVLQELGLKARLKPKAEGTVIFFECEDKLTFSPVTLALSDSESHSEGSGYLAGLTWQHFERLPASDNGWRYDRPMFGSREYIPLSEHELFEGLETVLREAGVVRTEDHPLYTSNEYLADTYEFLKIWLSEFGESSIAYERTRGIESLNFNDPSGTAWRIEFGRAATKVLADGKLFKRFEAETDGQYVAGEVGEMVRELHLTPRRRR